MNEKSGLNRREFDETLRKLAAGTKRSLPVFLNSRLLAIAKNAQELTPEANRAVMSAYLGATVKSERVNTKGRIVRRFGYKPTPVVYAIVNARRKKASMVPVPRAQMADEAKKFIASKFRAVGSLKAGWTKAIGILAAAVKAGISKTGPRVKMQSTAKPASDGFNPVATLEYRETVDRSGIRFIDARVELALEASFEREKGEMLRQLDKEMNDVARKAGAI